MAGRPSSRNQVLEAATELVAEVGAGRLTLDAVAARAGISKGGLLYNFPTKEALLQAMIQRQVERHTGLEHQAAETIPAGPNRVLRAALAARLDPLHLNCKAAHGMLAAVAESPQLLEPVRTAIAGTAAAIAEDSTDPERALILWLAMEGLLLQEILGTSPFDPAQRKRIAEAIIRIAEDSSQDTGRPAKGERKPAAQPEKGAGIPGLAIRANS